MKLISLLQDIMNLTLRFIKNLLMRPYKKLIMLYQENQKSEKRIIEEGKKRS